MDLGNTDRLNCVVVGEGPLLVQCCEQLLGGNFNLQAVVSTSPSIAHWGAAFQVNCFRSCDELLSSKLAIDYLFVIGASIDIPAPLFEQVKKSSLRFHEGRFASSEDANAPAWALLAAARDFAVCWHRMPSRETSAEVFSSESFPVGEGESVFTLRAKCHEAGLLGFKRLLKAIGSGELNFSEQNFSAEQLHLANDRPGHGGVIDWQHPADEIAAMIRALDFGSYQNTLLFPRVLVKGQAWLVTAAEAVWHPDRLPAGTLISIAGEAITVATGDGALSCHLASLESGAAVDAESALQALGIQTGALLPGLSDSTQQALSAAISNAAPFENEWRQLLLQAEPVTVPRVNQAASSTPDWQHRNGSGLMPGGEYTPQEQVALWALLLGRLNCKDTFTVAYRPLSLQSQSVELQSLFATTVPLPVELDPGLDVSCWLEQRVANIAGLESRGSFLSDMRLRLAIPDGVGDLSRYPLCIQRLENFSIEAAPENNGHQLIISIAEDSGAVRFSYDRSVVSDALLDELEDRYSQFVAAVASSPEQLIVDIPLQIDSDRERLTEWNNTAVDYDRSACVHQLFEQQVTRVAEREAYIFEAESISYQQLNERANQLARYLIEQGASEGDLVGILMERSIDMVAALLAVHKAGCAYVPLDPVYPRDRLAYMVEDSGLNIVLSQSDYANMLPLQDHNLILVDRLREALASLPADNLLLSVPSSSLAYMIYTSGSTGNPKGVMVEHRNVVNFFVGMDARVEPGPGTWLAVTSISFDISVLEIFWTLARGFTVLLYSDERRQKTEPTVQTLPVTSSLQQSIDFGLFYWNVADDSTLYAQDKYHLLLESAKFADSNGFNSVWTPERHFASFGGVYPNPSVTSAALATITQHVDLRGGSCVVPLHSPIRIAEEWSVVDNLSNGRAGIAIAAGWAPPDFVIKPENFAEAKKVMFESAQTVQRLWQGETINFPGPDGKDVPVRTLPRPLQKTLPMWVTTAGNVDSFKQAGTLGLNLLTHLLGQTVEEVADKVKVYREAWKAAGHEGEGTVTLMLHTFVGPNQAMVEEAVREPFKSYLKSAMFLVKDAAWNFPAFKAISEEQGKTLDEYFETITEDDLDAILEFAFQRYFHSSGLFGTPESCMAIVDRVKGANIDEIACLIDFGVDTELVLEHLPYLKQVREYSQQQPKAPVADEQDYSIQALLARHEVTHFQCTPSMATLLAADPLAREGLAGLKQMMVGGEAFPPELASDLQALVRGRVSNMYGPTESTIWSSTGDIDAASDNSVSIGRTLANQQIYILDERQQPMPVGLAGELVVGGEGVVRGYHQRDELNKDRFLQDPFSSGDDARMYRTGDLARYLDDGRIECLGRVDHQVKIRGYRVELGEIEARLRQHETVLEAAVVLREDTPGDKRLTAYIRTVAGAEMDATALKAMLKEHLPEFMVPAVFQQLFEMPLTPNGKIDRNAMPVPDQATVESSQREYLPPASDMEAIVAEVWQQALNVPRVGTRDNFFDIGGHSLLIIQVLKELSARVSKPFKMTDLFKYTTVQSLAEFLSSETTEAVATSRGQSRAAARKARRRRTSK